MKKYLLVLLLSMIGTTFSLFDFLSSTESSSSIEEPKQTAAGVLKDFCEESNQEEFDQKLGIKVLALCDTKEFRHEVAQLFKLKFTKEEIVRVKELFKVMIEVQKMALDPVFMPQLNEFMQMNSQLEQEGISDQESKKIMDNIQEECPLFCSWLILSEKLKFLQAGFGQGVQSLRLDIILAGILNDLDTIK